MYSIILPFVRYEKSPANGREFFLAVEYQAIKTKYKNRQDNSYKERGK
jgi:hypothetical protein